MPEMIYGADQTGIGATGFGSLNRGIEPIYSYYPTVLPVLTDTGNPGSDGISRTTSVGRELPSRLPITRGESRDVPNNASAMMRTITSRAIATATNSGSPAANAQQPYDQKTPLDRKIDDLFRGFYNEPIRGSADKSGEFVYIPPASGGGSSGSGGKILLLLIGVAIAGYYAYQKFGKGGE